MRMFKIFAAMAVVALIAPLTVAQDAEKKSDRKTESTDKADKDAKKAEGDDFDRGDAKAEKLFKRAYTRVYSAEAKGLKKLHADSNITVDASAMGFGEMPFDGVLGWKSGGKAVWESSDEDEGTNPLGNVSAVAKGVFEPYLAYVTGFEAWDVRFEKASFKFGDPVKEDDKEVAKTVIVDYADEDRSNETFTVAENKVTALSHKTQMQGQEATVTFNYEYEDQGKQLRLKSVNAKTELDMSGLSGQERDPKNPVPEGAANESLQGKIEVTKYGKVGEFEIALELEGSLSFMGMEIPTSLTLSKPKVNDDVKDDELPEESEDDAPEDDGDEF